MQEQYQKQSHDQIKEKQAENKEQAENFNTIF